MYCVQFWAPCYRKDVVELGKGGGEDLRGCCRDSRGPELQGEVGAGLGLYSLERRRMRGDLIEVYKITRGIDRVDAQSLCPE